MSASGRRTLTAAALAALLFSVFLFAQAPARPLRVLFVGNSYTYYNNLPDMFAKLAEAGHEPVQAAMVAPGGWRLRDHWEKGRTRDIVHEVRWDYVVLQEQSTLGTGTVVDGQLRVGSDDLFQTYAGRWAAEVRGTGARPVFFLTWAHQAAPDDQLPLDEAYVRAGRANHATVVPVGMAWNEVRQRHRGIALFQGDGSHPMPAGTYLAACTFYAALFDKSPLGLPAHIVGPPVDVETGAVDLDKSAVLVDLPAADAETLQAAAWAAWRAISGR